MTRTAIACLALACAASMTSAQDDPEQRPAWVQQAIDEAKALFKAGKFEESIARDEAAAKEADEKGEAHWEWQFQMWAGNTWYRRGKLDEALAAWERSLAIAERAAPDSLDAARSLQSIGLVHRRRGDLDRALACYERALGIRERLAPDSLDVADSLSNIGVFYGDRGDLDRALEYYEKALAIRERLAPDSLDVAGSLSNIGVVYRARGDLDRALEYHERSLAIKARVAPDSLYVAVSLGSIGILHHSRGDLDRALEYHERALAISERLAPGSLQMASSLTNIGNVHGDRGDLDRALEYHERTLAITQRLAPGSLSVATALSNVGEFYRQRGDLDRALGYYERDLAIRQRVAPDSLDVARSLGNIGLVYGARGDLERVLEYCERALGITERLAPDSPTVADTWSNIALARESQGDLEAALKAFTSAAEVLGRSRERASAQATRAAAFAEHRGPFRGLVRVLTALGRPREALAWLEEGRARTLADQLAERPVGLLAGASAELVGEQRRLDAERGRLQTRLIEAAGKKDKEAEKSARWELTRLQTKQDALEVRIRKESPAYAALQYPEPLDVAEMQAALDPGTLLLAYSVGKDATYLFALARDRGPTVIAIDVGSGRLKDQASRVRSLVARRREARGPLQELGRLLLGPLAERIAQAERVLILPDGPLHYVPFHALPYRDGNARGEDALPLGLEKPIHTCQSMTVYDIVRKQRAGRVAEGARQGTDAPTRDAPTRASGSSPRRAASPLAATALQLLAFGDPSYPEAGDGGRVSPLRVVHGQSRYRQMLRERSEQRRARRPPVTAADFTRSYYTDRGFSFGPLPESANEVNALAAMFAPSATVFTQSDATEEAAKTRCGDARYVHFACHGYLDWKRGMDSALVLSLPKRQREGQENGFLQAWEVFGLKLNADLVTLSACETALGQEMAGEGIIGLTRAFMYAGTPSVVVSLWRVSDESTSLFMQSFYGHLKAGEAKDVALQQAMRELRDHPEYSHPFFWAPFVLVGDYR